MTSFAVNDVGGDGCVVVCFFHAVFVFREKLLFRARGRDCAWELRGVMPVLVGARLGFFVATLF